MTTLARAAQEKIVELLINEGLADPELVNKVKTRLADGNGEKQLIEALVEENVISDEMVSHATAVVIGVPYVNLKGVRLDQDTLLLLPQDVLMRVMAVPLGVRDGVLVVAMLDVTDVQAIDYLSKISAGDMRFAYNQLEAIALSFSSSHLITLEDAKEISPMANYLSDKDENEHYDTVSALQKSIRGSEVDAAIYYLAKLIKSGDLEGLARRLMVTAYEDIGLANPTIGPRLEACINASERVGLPEARIIMSNIVIEMAGFGAMMEQQLYQIMDIHI